jgi:RNA polymerase sigma-70 factor (ECF subfamily)
MNDRDLERLASLTDACLVDLARHGNRCAFGELIRRHWKKCIDVGCCYLHNREDAEDEAQNAVLKAFRHLDQYHGEAEFSTWLARIVVNQCLMLFRSRRQTRFQCLEDGSDRAGTSVQLEEKGPDPESEMAQEEITKVLRREIRAMPRLLRVVIELRCLQELPMAEVARQLGITIPAAKSRLIRARTELRQRMIRRESGGPVPFFCSRGVGD